MEDNLEESAAVSALHIRDIPVTTMKALSTKAKAVNQDRMEYVRDLLIKASAVPERYAYRVMGQVGKGNVKRFSDHVNGTSMTFANFNQDEADAMQHAENYIRRNQIGDREKAFNLLVSQFGEDNVFEVPV